MSKSRTKAAKAAPAETPAAEPAITTFKGFNKDLSCRGFRYEIGKTFAMSGPIAACDRGFHACENPFDVWTYYGLGTYNRFAIVEQSGELSRHDSDSKVASAKITVTAELTLPQYIDRAIAWVIEKTKSAVAGGAEATTDKGQDGAQIGSSGYGARIGSSGYGARIGSSGNGAQIGSSGYGARIGSSGNGARIGSSGYGAQIGSSGYGARIGSSGYGARIGSSGNGAQIGSSGYGARIDAIGENAVIASAGNQSIAKGAAGVWIALAEFDDNGRCVGFATGCAGKDGVPVDTWLRASGGKLVEAA